jgi:hypothetical protein
VRVRFSLSGPVAALICLALTLTGCGNWLLDELADKETGKALVAGETATTQVFSGRLDDATPYLLFDLGPATTGDRWALSIRAAGGATTRLVLALFDADTNLLWRDRLLPNMTVEHVLRADTEHLYAGVTTLGGVAADIDLTAVQSSDGDVPPPQPQLVWLNFAGASEVRINNQPVETFGAFDAADLGAAYVDDTALIKAEIARTVRAQYADYDVTIVSSDEEPEPAAAHSTVHFGGADGRYLGIGDDVDRDGADPGDQAIVYTQDFAAYYTMRLSPEEMARMVGNVASHELGHLLGLFHTRGADQLMDDSRSAWELVGESRLERAPLAETVFPMGMEDAGAVLAKLVGRVEKQATP